MPYTVVSPGKSYSSNVTPRFRTAATAASMSSTSHAICVRVPDAKPVDSKRAKELPAQRYKSLQASARQAPDQASPSRTFSLARGPSLEAGSQLRHLRASCTPSARGCPVSSSLRRHSRLDPSAEDLDALFRPCAVARHRTVFQPAQNLCAMPDDVGMNPQIE